MNTTISPFCFFFQKRERGFFFLKTKKKSKIFILFYLCKTKKTIVVWRLKKNSYKNFFD